MVDGGHDEDDAAASEGTVQQRLAAIEGHLRDLSKWAMSHDQAVDERLDRLEQSELLTEVLVGIRRELRELRR